MNLSIALSLCCWIPLPSTGMFRVIGTQTFLWKENGWIPPEWSPFFYPLDLIPDPKHFRRIPVSFHDVPKKIFGTFHGNSPTVTWPSGDTSSRHGLRKITPHFGTRLGIRGTSTRAIRGMLLGISPLSVGDPWVNTAMRICQNARIYALDILGYPWGAATLDTSPDGFFREILWKNSPQTFLGWLNGRIYRTPPLGEMGMPWIPNPNPPCILK